MRLICTLTALGGLVLVTVGCGPKGAGGGATGAGSAVSPTPVPSPTPSAAERTLSEVRALWNQPPLLEGESVRWQVTPPEPDRFLDEAVPAVAGSSGEASFTAAGGRFLGNEVLRATAGEFRARHALLVKDGNSFHLYVVRSVPGGLAKIEVFRQGAVEPTIIYELDEYVRLPRKPGDPEP